MHLTHLQLPFADVPGSNLQDLLQNLFIYYITCAMQNSKSSCRCRQLGKQNVPRNWAGEDSCQIANTGSCGTLEPGLCLCAARVALPADPVRGRRRGGAMDQQPVGRTARRPVLSPRSRQSHSHTRTRACCWPPVVAVWNDQGGVAPI